MTLQKQHAFINLGQGIDTKTDPKLVVTGQLTSLVNAVFKKRGRIDKRNGNQILSATALDGSSLSNASALGVFNNELLQYNKQVVYSYSENANAWVNKGACVSASVTTSQIIKNTANQTQADWAYLNGIGVYAYEDSRLNVYATIVDITTGAIMLSDYQLDTSGTAKSRPRCVASNGYLYVFYYKAGALIGRRINPLLPTAFDSPVTITTDVNTANSHYDVIAFQTRLAFTYNAQSSTKIIFGFLDASLASLNATFPNVTIAENASNSLALVIGPTNTIYLAYHNGTDGVRVAIFNNGGTLIHGPFTLEAYTSTSVRNITGFKKRNDSGVTFFYEVSSSPSLSNAFLRKNTANTDGTVGTAADFMRSVGLFSRAFSYYFTTETTDHAYVCVTHQSNLQCTYFIARDDGLIVSKMQYTTGTGLTARSLLCNVFPTNDAETAFSFPILNKFRLVAETNSVFSLQGVSQTTINFDAEEQFNAEALGNNLHIVGGVLSAYDGQGVVEHGFHLFPEDLTAAQSGSTGVNDGVYNYIGLYEWTDNYGQIHRSATSVPVKYTVTGGPATVSIVMPTLRLTQKKTINGRTEISLVVYRTEGESGAPGEIYYRVTSVLSPTFNDTTIDTVTVVDQIIDSALIANEILYTTGGELDNIAPPSNKFIRVYKNRVILAGLEDANTLWTSKLHNVNSAVGFNDGLIINVPPQGGDISAIEVLDDKLVIFKQDRPFITYGDGPDNTGQGTSFANPQVITTDVGCSVNNSLVRTPKGIMFKSLKGIYLLDSSLNVNYIGAPVEDFNDTNITAGVLKSDVNQVRFATDSNTTLVYDYYFNTWSTFGNYSVLDASIWDNTYVFIDGTGKLLFEDTASYKDNGAGIQMSLTTGWITFDTIIGFQRIYKLSFVGEFKSAHKLRVRVAYDFSNAFTSTYIFDTSDLDIETYGSVSPYGADPLYGGDSSAYRFSATLDQQKCQAIRFEIMDLTTSASTGTGEALNITGFGLLLGVKGQVGKFKPQLQIAST